MSMVRHYRLLFIASCVLASDNRAIAQSTTAERVASSLQLIDSDPEPAAFFSGPVPRTSPVLGDVALNDVCSVGDLCWAVGERGVIVFSSDAGQSWKPSVLSQECSLQSVGFLTDQIGFVAGARYDSLNRQRTAILLKTRDGGQTWSPLCTASRTGEDSASEMVVPSGSIAVTDLPPLVYARFFDLDNAIAIGSPDRPDAASRVFRTKDGGTTWRVLSSDVPEARWLAGTFLSPDDGIVVGRSNAIAAVVSQQLVALNRPEDNVRRIGCASLDSRGLGWLAGDAGLLQHSTDGGITWKPISNALPPGLADVVDFRTVGQRNDVVCVAGRPGSLLLRSIDCGTSWTAVKLPDPVPVRKLHFVDDSTLLGISAFGIIQRSTDAGLTWQGVRNSGHRAAVLCLTTNPEDVSLRMLTSLGGDEGFRTVVAQPSVRLPRPGIDDALADEQLAAVLPQVGANVFEQDWMFTRTQPLQSGVASELIKAWSRQTDDRVGELLPQRLAALFCIWRPDAVCIERGSDRDQVAAVWLQALQTARRIAEGDDPRSAVLSSVGLAPWSVQRVAVRQSQEHRTPLTFAADELLSNLGTTTDLVAGYGRRQLTLMKEPSEAAAGQTAFDTYALHQADAATATFRHLLTGLMQAPGTESRRLLIPVDPDQSDQRKQLVNSLQIKRAALSSHVMQSPTPLSLIGQLQTIGRDLPAPLGLQQLTSLLQMYDNVQNLDGQIAVLQEIVERFPASPAAADAAQQLFQYYSSAELRFLRQQATAPESNQPAISGATPAQQPRIQQVVGKGAGIAGGTVHRAGDGTPLWNPQGADTAAVAELWDRQADAALQHLKQLAPERARSPELLLRLASNHQRVQDFSGHNQWVAQAAAADGLFAVLAQAELQSGHGAPSVSIPVIHVPRSSTKPYLDARLTDQIWQDATEIPLTSRNSSADQSSTGSLLMLGWDEDHLYIGGRIDRVAGRDYPVDKSAARRHDTDHGIRDRVEFSFDTDRDYTTAFHFVIDEAGQTSERCWRSGSWNPEWFVAADIDDTSWRFEIAIPHREMGSTAVKAGDFWALNLRRTVPGILEQSLQPDAADRPTVDTQGYGLLRFIRPQK